jgi:hypothetical protein
MTDLHFSMCAGTTFIVSKYRKKKKNHTKDFFFFDCVKKKKIGSFYGALPQRYWDKKLRLRRPPLAELSPNPTSEWPSLVSLSLSNGFRGVGACPSSVSPSCVKKNFFNWLVNFARRWYHTNFSLL